MTASEEGITILNVDDTEAIRYAKSRALRAAGYKVVDAATGAEALRAVADYKPRLALLDVKLPDMSGLDVCKIIKRDHPEVLVLQISATYISSTDRVRGLDSGADSYLTQPVTSDELAAAVGAMLRGRRGEEELRTVKESLEEQVAQGARALRAETAERERVEAALRQSQKLEALGHLTGGIAHDFNNLLMAVLGNLEILDKRLSQGRTDVRDHAANAIEAARRAASLTQRLLTFARQQPLEAEQVVLADLLRGLSGMIHTSIGPAIELEMEIPPDLWPIWCDAHQLENAIVNLVINARDAMPDGGVLRIVAVNEEIEAQPATPERRAGDYVVISVSDNGVGMPPHVLERVFDPFFTTKPIGKGTGLGLSMLYSFARQSQGWADVHSSLGKGTEVRLFLPRASGAMRSATPPAERAQQARGEGQTILVVEDEALIRDLVVETLAEHGYVCIEAGSAQQALDLQAAGTWFNLLVTDIGLPGAMTGRDLARIMVGQRPELKVVIISGHEASPRDEGEGGWTYLSKPFEMTRLVEVVSQALADGAER